MENKEIQYFILLKSLIQAKFLERNSSSVPDIAKWKGIDIIYFIEDLRKITRASISEKSFYTYFKNDKLEKTPRIDTLNILSIYCGYQSWHHYKQEQVKNIEAISPELPKEPEPKAQLNPEINVLSEVITEPEPAKQVSAEIIANDEKSIESPNIAKKSLKTYAYWLKPSLISLMAFVLLALMYKLIFSENHYQYCFIDSDRNKLVDNKLEIKIIRENESPILYRVNANECFKYKTHEKKIKMIINSPFYKTDTIYRNLENAPEQESIELKPNDYAIMLYYFSKSIKDLKLKRVQLNKLISDDAQIYQVYDSEYYGLENIDKQKYISLVTLPSTSLENLKVLETKMKNGKIVKIKFKIDQNENK